MVEDWAEEDRYLGKTAAPDYTALLFVYSSHACPKHVSTKEDDKGYQDNLRVK